MASAVAPPQPRAGDVLERLAARGGDVTVAHLAAAVQLRAEWAAGGGQAVQPALRAVGRGAAPLVLWVCVHDRTVKDWAALPINCQTSKPDPAKALGRLLCALEWLAAHYAAADARGRAA